jgi:hypothetical protein
MMPLSKIPSSRDQAAVDYGRTADSVEESAHRHLAHVLLRQEQAVCLARGVSLGAQQVGRIQDVCTRSRQIPLQSISKLRAARNMCLVHLGQHQAAVGAACKATSTRTCKERNASSTQGVPAGADLRASSSTSTASSTRTGRRRRQLQFRLVDCRHYHSRLSDHHHHHHHPRYRCNHPRPRPRPRHRHRR